MDRPFGLALEVSHLIAMLPILLSLVTFYAGWRKDRKFARRQQADQIRIAAAMLISKLERWREIALSVFDEVQAGFVEASEIAGRNPDKLDLVGARDFLWKDINRARATVRRAVMQENIQTSHASLIAYCPASRLQFNGVFTALNEIEDRHVDQLLAQTEQVVLSFADRVRAYQTAQMGNELRACAAKVRMAYANELGPQIDQAIATLNSMIARNDENLIFDRRGLTGSSTQVPV